jgi:hypothetical protein
MQHVTKIVLHSCAGWHSILLTWAYVFVFWVAADFLKVLIRCVRVCVAERGEALNPTVL